MYLCRRGTGFECGPAAGLKGATARNGLVRTLRRAITPPAIETHAASRFWRASRVARCSRWSARRFTQSLLRRGHRRSSESPSSPARQRAFLGTRGPSTAFALVRFLLHSFWSHGPLCRPMSLYSSHYKPRRIWRAVLIEDSPFRRLVFLPSIFESNDLF